MQEAYSIGIIGGADGPTAVLVSGRFPFELILLLVLGLGALIWYFKRKNHNHRPCRWYAPAPLGHALG